ncbi:jasmonate-induced oxygenase 1-like [Rutidosis leptorrhynchoides]|uniref:jasmonate-induced oxygenase 1-like n=1 Tax=Rutidosis leptorrhynchoides TaxID=125765 RepID=UPI003A98E680
MSCLHSHWPEPVVRVQSLAESGIQSIPKRYIKPPSDRPNITSRDDHVPTSTLVPNMIDDIPVIDIQHLVNSANSDPNLRADTLSRISDACREWGFFQVVNHGISHDLLKDVRELWRDFFKLPVEVKQEYANAPDTYEGYGSRLGIEKGAILDWSDYFFLNFMPVSMRKTSKWPSRPESCRELTAKYGEEVVKFCGSLLKVFSLNLGLKEDHLQNAFGGQDIGACLRVNFYPKCPQPDLTLGLSPHSDPGGMTLLLPDENVAGLQVRRGDDWVTVKPVTNAIIVNLGDQIQVLSNAVYKSVEHRVIVNSVKDRVSLAFFYNPKSDILIKPLEELVTEDMPALYKPMTYAEYRLHIRTKGPSGKAQVESLKATKQ